MLNDIIFTFDKNYKRITNLLDAYAIISEIDTKNPSKGDILRALVVLTHSTFEDFIFLRPPQKALSVLGAHSCQV